MIRRIRDLLDDQGFTISGARNKLQEIVQTERDKRRNGEVMFEGVESLDDMDADHVAAWSKGGETSPENCQMLCKSHNRAKGNR